MSAVLRGTELTLYVLTASRLIVRQAARASRKQSASRFFRSCQRLGLHESAEVIVILPDSRCCWPSFNICCELPILLEVWRLDQLLKDTDKLKVSTDTALLASFHSDWLSPLYLIHNHRRVTLLQSSVPVLPVKILPRLKPPWAEQRAKSSLEYMHHLRYPRPAKARAEILQMAVVVLVVRIVQDHEILYSIPKDMASVRLTLTLSGWRRGWSLCKLILCYLITDILINPGACQGIVDKANLKSTDKVLEVGPGTGNLTTLILPKCKTLLAVEAWVFHSSNLAILYCLLTLQLWDAWPEIRVWLLIS